MTYFIAPSLIKRFDEELARRKESLKRSTFIKSKLISDFELTWLSKSERAELRKFDEELPLSIIEQLYPHSAKFGPRHGFAFEMFEVLDSLLERAGEWLYDAQMGGLICENQEVRAAFRSFCEDSEEVMYKVHHHTDMVYRQLSLNTIRRIEALIHAWALSRKLHGMSELLELACQALVLKHFDAESVEGPTVDEMLAPWSRLAEAAKRIASVEPVLVKTFNPGLYGPISMEEVRAAELS